MLYRTILKLFGDIKLGAALPPLLPSLFHFNFPPLSLTTSFLACIVFKIKLFPTIFSSWLLFCAIWLRLPPSWVTLKVSLTLSDQSLCWRVFALLSVFHWWCSKRGRERESNRCNTPNPLRLAVFLQLCTLQVLTELTTHTVIHPWIDYEMMGTKHGSLLPNSSMSQSPNCMSMKAQTSSPLEGVIRVSCCDIFKVNVKASPSSTHPCFIHTLSCPGSQKWHHTEALH